MYRRSFTFIYCPKHIMCSYSTIKHMMQHRFASYKYFTNIVSILIIQSKLVIGFGLNDQNLVLILHHVFPIVR
ncbi:hypothetical protein BD770DRAFT_391653 [Pilaira anomala]|nr:hypothetical protein BD770DRAFT_391653 [Pilaira anomala]